MDPALAHLLEVVLLDAVKILGPAAIAAIVSYRTARAQFQSKIDELSRNQSFQARQSLFAHIKERLANVDSSQEKVSQELGQLMGHVTGMHASEDENVSDSFLVFLGRVCASMATPARLEVRATLADLQRLALSKSELFTELSRFQRFELAEAPTTLGTVREALLHLYELNNLVSAGLRAALNEEMKLALAPYVQATEPTK